MPRRNRKDIPKSPYYKRVKTPTVIQMEAVECGAASLSMILSYYGKFISLEELRITCGVSRDGVNALSILKAAENYGLQGEGYRLELEDLYDMPLPMIAFWNFEHFVVIEGFARDCVYINDPATGPVRISYEELDLAFTGLALTFETTPQFVKSGKPVSTLELLYHRVKEMKLSFIFAFLTGLCLVIPKLSLSAFTQIFIDDILIGHIFSWQNWFLFGMALIIFLTLIFSFLQQWVLSRLFMKVSIQYSSDFLWHTLRLPLSFYQQRYSGEIAYRMSLNDSVSHTMTKQLSAIIIDVTVAIIFGIAMFYYDYLIASIGMLMMLGNLALMHYLYRSRLDAYAYYQQTLGKSIAYSMGALSSIETVKSTGVEHKLFSRWAGYYTKTINALQDLGSKDVLSGVVAPLLETLTMVIVLGLGAWRVMHGSLTIGMLMALKILMQNFMEPVVRLINFSQSTQLLQVDISRLNDVLKNPIDPSLSQKEENHALAPSALSPTKLKGDVEVQNLTFGFNPLLDPVISHLDLQIAKGTSVAIVGPSGCGKSTLARLIGGLMIPWEGEVLFDRVSRSDLPRPLITNSLAIIEQEASIFSGSIKENILYFDPFAEQNEMIQAAKDACIHQDIMLRRGGYDSILESGGSNLSGGQKQRIAIAQALVRRPSILIVDEGTSALDAETEAQVIKNIRRRACTCLIIAHRFSAIMGCDRIIVVDKGKVIQQGTHTELVSVPGLYKTLVEAEITSEKS